MTPARQNFTIQANGYWDRIWQIQNNGVAVDITGYDFKLAITNGKGAAAPDVVELSVGNGITVIDAAQGKIQISIPPQPQIAAKTVYSYDLIAIISSKPYVWLQGSMAFEPGSTYI